MSRRASVASVASVASFAPFALSSVTVAAVLSFTVAGCGGAISRTPAIAEMNQAREAPAAKDGAVLAPEAFARADRIRKDALALADSGDEAAASLTAERATAAYARAVLVARRVRATRAEAVATTDRSRAETELSALVASRVATDREADALDKQLKVARESRVPAPSGKADPARAAARLVAARSLLVQARLLCGAAKLVDEKTTGLSEAEAALGTLDTLVEGKAKASPIDEVARARATCLSLLTRARRVSNGVAVGASDALLAELAASAGWDPIRDERGVVVVLRNTWSTGASGLTKEAETRLAELGRVAMAHPQFGVQVVVHTATSRAPGELTIDRSRADAAAKVIQQAGGSATKVSTAAVGASAPIIDPSDAKNRQRNERLEVVFVSRAD